MLLQVVFHARVAEEAGMRASTSTPWPGCSSKLVRRHPHVFADGGATSPAEVEQAWERIKAEERGHSFRIRGRRGRCRPAPRHPDSMPGELAADKVLARLRRRGLVAQPASLDAVDRARADIVAAEGRMRAALRDLAAGADVAGEA